MESVIVVMNVMVVVLFGFSMFAFWKAHKADKVAQGIGAKILVRLEKLETERKGK